MEKIQGEWSRRKFIYTLTGAGAVLVLNPLLSWAGAGGKTDPEIAKIVDRTIGIDTHNHIDVPLNAAELPGPRLELGHEMKVSGLSAICMTFAVDYQELRNPGDAFDRFLNGMTAMDKVLAANQMKRSMNLQDIRAAHSKRQPTVIQSVEGAHFLEGHLDRLKIAWDRGLRHLTLLHDHDASVPLGDVFTNPAQFDGLTAFGAEVIKECNRLGILVDLSHGTNEMVNAALKVATRPVLVSHTGLDSRLGQNERMGKMMLPRLISKEQAKIVANAGGVIGVWTHLAESPLEYAENIKAMVDVVGIDHVCIGTDTKLTPAYRSPAAPGQQQPGPAAQQSGSDHKQEHKGDKDHNRMGKTTNETWPDTKAGFYYTVVAALLQTGFNEEEIAKIGGGNFCRVFDAATKK